MVRIGEGDVSLYRQHVLNGHTGYSENVNSVATLTSSYLTAIEIIMQGNL